MKDVRESLLVQIRHHPSPHPQAAALVENWLDALEKQHLREIEKGMHISEAQLKDIMAFVRTLDPLPGQELLPGRGALRAPRCAGDPPGREFIYRPERRNDPVLGINPLFDPWHDEGDKDPKTRQFVSQNLQDARWFIRTIGQRNETLLKVCRTIVDFQREFFLKGPKYMRPLTLKDVAGEMGVHEATVSRITSSKYMQTEWGIFSLKHFFSNSVAGTGRRARASRRRGEGDHPGDHRAGGRRGRPFRPEDRRILAAKGVSLARRTVAKYRGELAIDSSYQRRRT